MGLFRRNPDPLQSEIRRLEKESRRLSRQEQVLREEMDNPHTGASRERPVPILIEKAPAARPQRRDVRRLRIQERRARNRFVVLCVVLSLLLLLLYRVVT